MSGGKRDMYDQSFGFLLLLLALMLFISYLLHLGLDRLRMPSLLAPLLVGFIFQLLPFASPFTSVAFGETYYLLAQLGIIFLLFMVGLRFNVQELKSLSMQIAALSMLNLGFSSVLGFLILLSFGYPPFISVLVSTALATVAETTIAPILDELGVIRTKMASLILGPGVVDDIAEVIIASLASLIVGSKEATVDPVFLALGLSAFTALALAFHRLILPLIARFDEEPKDPHLFLLMVSTALIFTVVSQAFKFGILLGAIVAGLTFQSFLNSSNAELKAFPTLRAIAYGFLGPVFFFGIGLSTSLSTLAEGFQLTLWLLAANFLGKFLGVLIVGRMAKLNFKAIAVIGLGLSAKFSMGIIPVQIFYSAGLIDQQLFSAFVAVSAITTMFIPFSLAYIVNRWRQSLT
ncbi:MAG: cation:proton antiporter [Candidatus Bathyarchaeia archaeon]